jgi:hypothetical protein
VGDWTIWLAFLAELVVMLAIVPNRRHWLAQHPLDVAIVVLTPPSATALLQSVRLLRLLRLVRLVRLASLGRSVFSLTAGATPLCSLVLTPSPARRRSRPPRTCRPIGALLVDDHDDDGRLRQRDA